MRMRVYYFWCYLAIEFTIHSQMCDLHSKLEEDRHRTKTAVSMENDRDCSFCLSKCHALHWTDNKMPECHCSVAPHYSVMR